jgi:hypothetical protein
MQALASPNPGAASAAERTPMLGWIKKGQSDHPMADEKGAREFLAELPANDAYRALEEIGFGLDALRSAAGIKPQRAFEIADQLDQAAKPHQRRLTQEYLGGVRLQRFQEQRIWNAVVELWRQLAATYEFCLGHTLPGASGSAVLKAQAPVIGARALRALGLELKWALLRYGPVDPTVWGRFGAIYAQAEAGSYAAKACAIYPGPHGESSVEREYLRALMLAISATDCLLPRKLELGERLVAHFAPQFVLQRQPTPGCHYCVDLQAAKPPARMVAQVNPSPSVRYFGPGSAGDGVQQLVDVIATTGALPSSLVLGAAYEPSLVSEVARHLARYWSATPPTRREERRRSVKRIHVVHDFDRVLAIIAGESDDLDFQQNIETWTVENESAGGFGAAIPQSMGDWLRVGSLLGIKLVDGNAWGVGIVRRLTNQDGKERYVGIQTLARGVARVTLFPLNAPAAAAGDDAVLLPSSASDSSSTGELSLLMRLGTFSPRHSLQMRAYERDYLLVPKGLIEGGQDFDMAKFRVLQRAA